MYLNIVYAYVMTSYKICIDLRIVCIFSGLKNLWIMMFEDP